MRYAALAKGNARATKAAEEARPTLIAGIGLPAASSGIQRTAEGRWLPVTVESEFESESESLSPEKPGAWDARYLFELCTALALRSRFGPTINTSACARSRATTPKNLQVLGAAVSCWSARRS